MKKIFIALFISSLAVTVTNCTKDESYTISPCDHDGRTQTGTLSRTTGMVVRATVMTSPATANEDGKAKFEDRYYIQQSMPGWNNSSSINLYPCNLPVEFQRDGIAVEFEGFYYQATDQEKQDGISPISLSYLVETQMVRGGC